MYEDGRKLNNNMKIDPSRVKIKSTKKSKKETSGGSMESNKSVNPNTKKGPSKSKAGGRKTKVASNDTINFSSIVDDITHDKETISKAFRKNTSKNVSGGNFFKNAAGSADEMFTEMGRGSFGKGLTRGGAYALGGMVILDWLFD